MFDEIVATEKLTTKRGAVIGFGRFKIHKTDSAQPEIPILSYIVIAKNDGGCVCSCIPMKMDGYGKNYNEAKQDMLDNVLYYLKVNFKEYEHSCWENLLSLFEIDEDVVMYWHAYFAMQLKFAEKGLASDPHVETIRWNNDIK